MGANYRGRGPLLHVHFLHKFGQPVPVKGVSFEQMLPQNRCGPLTEADAAV